jgi:putative GTP pyrophosphokinase
MAGFLRGNLLRIRLQGKEPLVPRFAHLSREKTFRAVADAEASLGALERMNGFSIAADAISKARGKGSFYHLIILNSLEKSVEIHPYDRDSFEQAVADYSKAEKEAVEGKKIEPVLVSAGPVQNLRRAYPNFFLDIGDFVKAVEEILSMSKKNELRVSGKNGATT